MPRLYALFASFVDYKADLDDAPSPCACSDTLPRFVAYPEEAGILAEPLPPSIPVTDLSREQGAQP